MTKKDIIEKMAQDASLSSAGANRALQAFIETMQEALVNEGRIVLPNLGTLVVESRNERTGRNPRTGETITIPERKVIKFKMSSSLKAKLQ